AAEQERKAAKHGVHLRNGESNRQRESLSGREYLQPSTPPGDERSGLIGLTVYLVIRPLRLVVEQHEPLHLRLQRQLDGVVVCRVSPANVLAVLIDGEHRIVDQDAGPAAELDQLPAPRGR